MRKLIVPLLFLLIFLPSGISQSRIFPEKPSGWVNDYANFLSRDEVNRLNKKLGNYEDSTSTQIFIVTLNETGGSDIAMLAAQIGQTWGVGQKGKENGIVILVYPQERDVFIATGYGLEEYITDALAKRIVEKEIKPNFRNGNYFAGLDEATDVIMSLLSGVFTADQYSKKGNSGEGLIGIIFLIILFLFIFRSGKGRATSIGKSIPFWIAMSMLSGSRNSHKGSWGGFSSGSGGFGGFSGGGGGRFGGGGAGGSW